jgi:antitoxin component of RelBE/YafQ-DinJ toxin-antitoxin module
MQIQQQVQDSIHESNATETLTIQLPQSVRRKAEQICASEGITLDRFVNVAIADRIAHDAHLAWLARRKVPTEASIEEARRILRRPSSRPPDPGDELPEGYTLDPL